MRIAGLLVVAACGASSPPRAPKQRAHPCDPAHWSELAESRLRVWPEKATAPARVVEVAGSQIEVASVTTSVIVARWVTYESLEPVAMSAMNVSPSPGAQPEPALRILVGHRLDPPSRGWAAVRDPDGFVPASVAGTMWTDPDRDDDEFAVAMTGPPTGTIDQTARSRAIRARARSPIVRSRREIRRRGIERYPHSSDGTCATRRATCVSPRMTPHRSESR